MRIRLDENATLASGSGAHPVLLVDPTRGLQVPLSTAESMIITLLLEQGPSSANDIFGLALSFGSDPPTVQALIDKLLASGLLVRDGVRPAQPGAPAAFSQTIDEATDPGWDEITNPDVLAAGEREGLLAEDELAFDDGATVVMTSAPSFATIETPLGFPHDATTSPAAPPAPPAARAWPIAAPPPPMAPASPHVARPAQPIGLMTTDELATTSPVMAAVSLLHRGRFDEADARLRQILEQDPRNEVARVWQRALATTRAGRKGGRAALWIAVVVSVLLAAVVTTGFVVRRPAQLELDCRLALVSLPPLRAPIGGRLKILARNVAGPIPQGAALAEIKNEERARRLPRLRSDLQDAKEQLEIMRIGGSDRHERQQKGVLAAARDALAALPEDCGKKPACELRRAALELKVQRAKKKIYYCEWKAFPNEIDKQQRLVAELEKALAQLAAAPSSITLEARSLAFFDFTLADARELKAGEVIARRQRADMFNVQLRGAPARLEAGKSARVTLESKEGKMTYDGKLAQGGTKEAHVAVSARLNAREASSCRAVFESGTMSLWRALLR